MFAAGLRTYEIIIPAQVDIEGNVLSHDVHHTVKRRWRRDAEEEVPTIHYKLQVRTFIIHHHAHKFLVVIILRKSE